MFYNVLFFPPFLAPIGFQIILFSFNSLLCSQIFSEPALSETFVSLPGQVEQDPLQSANGNIILNCNSHLPLPYIVILYYIRSGLS